MAGNSWAAYHVQKGEAFLGSTAVQAALSKEQGSRCSQHCSYIMEGQVPADLEAIFCRGIEWDSGVEHVLLLQVLALPTLSPCPTPLTVRHVEYSLA